MARVLVLDVRNKKVREAQCESLDDFYRELDADPFDIAVRKIGGQSYDIFCDDIGMWREQPIVSAIGPNGEPMLVGNLVFANHNQAGETTDLSDDDINRIIANMVIICKKDGGRNVAVMCE